MSARRSGHDKDSNNPSSSSSTSSGLSSFSIKKRPSFRDMITGNMFTSKGAEPPPPVPLVPESFGLSSMDQGSRTLQQHRNEAHASGATTRSPESSSSATSSSYARPSTTSTPASSSSRSTSATQAATPSPYAGISPLQWGPFPPNPSTVSVPPEKWYSTIVPIKAPKEHTRPRRSVTNETPPSPAGLFPPKPNIASVLSDNWYTTVAPIKTPKESSPPPPSSVWTSYAFSLPSDSAPQDQPFSQYHPPLPSWRNPASTSSTTQPPAMSLGQHWESSRRENASLTSRWSVSTTPSIQAQPQQSAEDDEDNDNNASGRGRFD